MKTKSTLVKKMNFSLLAALAMGLSINAQNNVSYTTDAIPVPGGSDNVVVGLGSMLSNAGSANATYGNYAMTSNVNGGANTAGGYGAMNANIDGSENCAFGTKCLVSNQYGYYNCAFGVAALSSNDGSANTAMGHVALSANTTGKYNSAIGYSGMVTNQTGDCNTTAGSFADMAASNLTNATAIGCGAIALNSNELWLGDANTKVWTVNSYNVSDGRFKRNVTSDRVKGLEFINLLRPVTYNFDAKAFTEFQTKNLPAEKRKSYLEKDFSKTTAELQTGFIAQEVEEAAKKSGYNFSGVHTPENADDAYGVSYYQFVVPLVKAVQEQQQMIADQKQLIVMQQLANERMQKQLDEQQQAINALLARGGATGLNQANTTGNMMEMGQNEPNPFVHETMVKYNLPKEVNNAYLAVYDLSGKQIASFDLVAGKGDSSITINSDKLAAGIYIYSIVADGKIVDSKRMVVAQK